MGDDEYVVQLEQVLRKVLKPVEGIPFSVAIRVLTGYRVLEFDKTRADHKDFLERLQRGAVSAGQEMRCAGIRARRPNEAGNKLEPFVITALRKEGLRADRPRCKDGRIRAAGYPDLRVDDPALGVVYLDCKTFSAGARGQGLRTFYMSPAANPKITSDGYHLLLAYELESSVSGDERLFVPVRWAIYKLDKLRLKLKHELNASNRDVYREEWLLANGSLIKSEAT